MKQVRDIIDRWKAKILGDARVPEVLNGVYKFVIHGDGGGTWIFRCRPPVEISEGEGSADCTVSVSATDFVALAERKLNPQVAFLTGKLQVSGDKALALRLSQLF